MSTAYNQRPYSPYPQQYRQYQQQLAPRQPNSYMQQPSSPTSQTKPSYPCLYPECAGPAYTGTGPFVPGTSFTRHADLQRHIDVVHMRSSLQLVDCPFQDCHRVGKEGFTRKDKMTDHLREVHKLDIPKRQSVKRI
ncbi:hypothetical protein EJ03DRAFT_205774 [Teratosphaeria nubilosa]|uniref:C2H2-domain containing protein second zinc finger domain-containing protein n=1 Tax=Teratosphaeria nubilosa TaxID=161662 RepID=A0A6G1KYV4_9PEZI|nr:hypothetical protein EJ03DRAFT_205774 [Teratosphaeria nubilosa]